MFRNMKLLKFFIRFDEVAKYLDGTLRMIIRVLEKRIKQKEIIHPKKSEKEVIIKALTIIEDHIQERNAIRRFERCYDEHPKKFFAFTHSIR